MNNQCKLSKECYVPLLKIRFLRIYNSLDNTVFINLYFSHKQKKDYYFSILYDISNNKRYLHHCIRDDINDPIILWED
jgi:hypothetical protein